MIEKIRIPPDDDPIPSTTEKYLCDLIVENREKLNEIIDWINEQEKNNE